MNQGILESIISEDYELIGGGRWWHAQEHDSLVVDAEKQIFYWNSKGIVGDAYTWLVKIKGFTPEEARRFLKTFDNYYGEFIHIVKGKEDKDIIVYPNLVDIFWSNGLVNRYRDYWYNRNFTDETINRFKLGYYNEWFTIPIFQDGLFKNFQCRRDVPNKAIKSWYKGIGPLLFNSDILKFTDSVYICEGPTDAISLSQHGLMAISNTAGSETWLDSWFKYFIHQKKIYIIYDNDDAGNFGAKKVAKKLGELRCKIYTFKGYRKGYDANDFFLDGARDEFVNLVEERSKYVFES